jgi:hypothetical protein
MKFRNILLPVLVVSIGLFSSCKEDKKVTPAESKIETNDNPKATSELNPEHGYPGHRCDLPVGAPLDQAAKKVEPATTNTTGVSPVWKNPPTPTKNPPHGEAGHDCSVPVGADLN